MPSRLPALTNFERTGGPSGRGTSWSCPIPPIPPRSVPCRDPLAVTSGREICQFCWPCGQQTSTTRHALGACCCSRSSDRRCARNANVAALVIGATTLLVTQPFAWLTAPRSPRTWPRRWRAARVLRLTRSRKPHCDQSVAIDATDCSHMRHVHCCAATFDLSQLRTRDYTRVMSPGALLAL
jgi:hypothetical protein